MEIGGSRRSSRKGGGIKQRGIVGKCKTDPIRIICGIQDLSDKGRKRGGYGRGGP
jgi:hypothetical protein